MKDDYCDVLLSTFNGETYLEEQLKSLLAQSYEKLNILVRDDGSSDKTKSILDLYRKKYPSKIQVIEDEKGNLGSKRSFEILMTNSKSQFIAFCDQDDVWIPKKIENAIDALNSIKHTETKLYCSDVSVVDENLKILNKSYFQKHLFLNKKNITKINKIAFRNFAIGATLVITRNLKEISLPVSSQALMHDWWVLINAAHYGEIYVDENVSMFYRQHKSNVIGSPENKLIFNFQFIKKQLERSHINTQACILQAKSFYEQNKSNSRINLSFFKLLGGISDKSLFFKIKFYFEHNLFKPNLLLSLIHLYSFVKISK